MDRTRISTGIVVVLSVVLLPAFAAHSQQRVKLSAVYELERGTRVGRIIVTAEIPPEHHIYALSQQGTPPPSKILVSQSDQFSLTGTFQPDTVPTVVEFDPLFENRIEKHTGTVVFTAPIELAQHASATELNVQLKFDGQVCSQAGSCFPLFGKKVAVKFGGYYKKQSEPGNLE